MSGNSAIVIGRAISRRIASIGSAFSTYRGTVFDVRFKLNRLPYRRMHQALTNGNDQSRFLFPNNEHVRDLRPVGASAIARITPINRLVGTDEEQLETVATILNRPAGSVPFVVFGP